MKRILITGGFGFLGSHLIERLARDEENRIHVVDNLSTSPLPLDHLLSELGPIHRLTYDIITVEEFCRTRADEMVFDEIYHLASVVGPAGVLQHAGTMAYSIISDCRLLMDLTLKNNAKLVDISTSEVYGGGQEGYCREDFPKIIQSEVTIRLEYAAGKLASEIALINATKVSPLQCSIIRPFNIAGPRQASKGGFVLPRFVGQALTQQPLTVFGNGNQLRAFTHVKDVVEGIVLTMEKGRSGEVYNVGNSHNRISVLELAQMILAEAYTTGDIHFVDPKTIYGSLYAEANDKFPDDSKIVTELGWQPRYSNEDIVRDTLSYMNSLPEEAFTHLTGLQRTLAKTI